MVNETRLYECNGQIIRAFTAAEAIRKYYNQLTDSTVLHLRVKPYSSCHLQLLKN